MGVRRSEYRRSFVRSPDKDLADDFESKFDYRLHRRFEEHRHTPFEWDYTSDSDSDLELAPPNHDKHEHTVVKQTLKQQQNQIEDEGNIRDHVEKRKEERKEKNQQTRPKRPVKPGLYRPIPKATPLEPSNKHRIKKEASLDSSVPFVPFGVGHKEKSTGALRTHNVRSSADIYPSALRAKKRHELDVERREERARTRPLRECRPSQFNQQMRRETSVWDSEYRTHYRGYEPGAYKPARTPGGAKFYVPL